MPYPPEVARIVLSGGLPGGEIWTTGFWITNAAPHSQGQATALAQLTMAALTSADASGAMRVTAQHLFGNQTTFLKCQAYIYPDGSNKAAYIGEADVPQPYAGPYGDVTPNQIALVLSLRTQLPGRRNRGRMYLPATGLNFNNEGQAGLGTTEPVSAAWATFFTDQNASTEGKVVVVSAVGTTATPVSSVQMDTRADVQRRRANAEKPVGISVQAVTL